MFSLLSVSPVISAERIKNFWLAFKEVFSQFGFLDAIDILVLSALIFVAIRFFKNRKAGALLVGITVCAAILAIASIFSLNAVAFVFSGIFKVGIIALVIIFQPELREALEKMGSGSISSIFSFGSRKNNAFYHNAIDNICVAVNDLSRTKTGALIVIERTTQLEDIIQTGVSLNADVSSFLIRNLFYDKAPLHDGAVIIEDGKISAAGCLLPLTRRTDIDSNLGTRHRAAIGMSEISDSIIIVVSEETGVISVAFDCDLTRDYTPESLRRYLKKKIIREDYEEN